MSHNDSEYARNLTPSPKSGMWSVILGAAALLCIVGITVFLSLSAPEQVPLPTSTPFVAVTATSVPTETQIPATDIPATPTVPTPVSQLVCAQYSTVPLHLYTNLQTTDNTTIAAGTGETEAVQAGYQLLRTEGQIFLEQVEGTVPLKLYYSPERNDYFTTVTQAAEEAAVGSGYQLIRIDGYVFSMQMEGTVPLNLYYSYDQNDNLMTATQAGNDAATQAGYQFIRTEGYICP